MANLNDEKAMLLQNLQDAGCDEATIECCLLDGIHKEQDKLESLDYLIYQLKKTK